MSSSLDDDLSELALILQKSKSSNNDEIQESNNFFNEKREQNSIYFFQLLYLISKSEYTEESSFVIKQSYIWMHLLLTPNQTYNISKIIEFWKEEPEEMKNEMFQKFMENFQKEDQFFSTNTTTLLSDILKLENNHFDYVFEQIICLLTDQQNKIILINMMKLIISLCETNGIILFDWISPIYDYIQRILPILQTPEDYALVMQTLHAIYNYGFNEYNDNEHINTFLKQIQYYMEENIKRNPDSSCFIEQLYSFLHSIFIKTYETDLFPGDFILEFIKNNLSCENYFVKNFGLQFLFSISQNELKWYNENKEKEAYDMQLNSKFGIKNHQAIQKYSYPYSVHLYKGFFCSILHEYINFFINFVMSITDEFNQFVEFDDESIPPFKVSLNIITTMIDFDKSFVYSTILDFFQRSEQSTNISDVYSNISLLGAIISHKGSQEQEIFKNYHEIILQNIKNENDFIAQTALEAIINSQPTNLNLLKDILGEYINSILETSQRSNELFNYSINALINLFHGQKILFNNQERNKTDDFLPIIIEFCNQKKEIAGALEQGFYEPSNNLIIEAIKSCKQPSCFEEKIFQLVSNSLSILDETFNEFLHSDNVRIQMRSIQVKFLITIAEMDLLGISNINTILEQCFSIIKEYGMDSDISLIILKFFSFHNNIKDDIKENIFKLRDECKESQEPQLLVQSFLFTAQCFYAYFDDFHANFSQTLASIITAFNEEIIPFDAVPEIIRSLNIVLMPYIKTNPCFNDFSFTFDTEDDSVQFQNESRGIEYPKISKLYQQPDITLPSESLDILFPFYVKLEMFPFSNEYEDEREISSNVLEAIFQHFTILAKLATDESIKDFLFKNLNNIFVFVDKMFSTNLFTNKTLNAYVEMYNQIMGLQNQRRNPFMGKKNLVKPIIMAASSSNSSLSSYAKNILSKLPL